MVYYSAWITLSSNEEPVRHKKTTSYYFNESQSGAGAFQQILRDYIVCLHGLPSANALYLVKDTRPRFAALF